MKKKIISKIFLISAFFVLLILNYNVDAWSGEIDPNGYITMPDEISMNDGIGTGTISLSSSASGYSISYQKVDITISTYNSITAKGEEYTTYVQETNEILETKQTEVSTLQSEYETLKNSGTATEEEIQEAEEKYTTAYTECQELLTEALAKAQELQQELYDLIPDYTDSWQTTTNSTNNIQFDFSSYSGEIAFVVWAKITNGTNTYYNFKAYSSTYTSSDEDENGSEETEDGWADFSNAKIELVKYGTSGASIEISGVTPVSGNHYYIYIDNSSDKPDITQVSSDDRLYCAYDEDSGKLITSEGEISRRVELNQDMYVSIIEYSSVNNEYSVMSYGTKLEKFDEPVYADAFYATMVTCNSTQILTYYTHSIQNSRKIEIKIGKITDTAILNKLKNSDSTGFSDLMSFAKSDNGIYDETLSADSETSTLGYCSYNDNHSVIDLSGLEDGAFYYLYVKTDDEDGTYVSNECVTFASSSTFSTGEWYLFFYGSEDFDWGTFSAYEDGDTTTMSGVLPQTGVKYGILFVAVLCGVMGTVAAVKYKKYNI